MPLYHLHRTMQFACGKHGKAFERDAFDAADLWAAIDIALARTTTPPGLDLTSLLLCASSGAMLWTKTFSRETDRLSPATC